MKRMPQFHSSSQFLNPQKNNQGTTFEAVIEEALGSDSFYSLEKDPILYGPMLPANLESSDNELI